MRRQLHAIADDRTRQFAIMTGTKLPSTSRRIARSGGQLVAPERREEYAIADVHVTSVTAAPSSA